MPNPLSKRRSFLDLLTPSSNSDGRPRTAILPSESPLPNDGRPKSEYGLPRSRLSRELLRDDLPEPKDSQDALSTRSRRFSMLRFRNYSEPQLAVRASETGKQAKSKEVTPPVPAIPANADVPAIVKTAPTMDHANVEQTLEPAEPQEREREARPSLFKRSMSKGRSPSRREPRKSTDEKRGEKKSSSLRWRKIQGRSTGLEDLQRMAASQVASNQNTNGPPLYGDESNSMLALPVPPPRFSESSVSRSEGSNDSEIYGATTTTTHTVSTHTTFFRLARRNKNRNSLFPLPVKIPPPSNRSPQSSQDGPPTPRASTSAISSQSEQPQSNGNGVPGLYRRHTEDVPPTQHPLAANAALARNALSFAEPSGMSLILRNESQRSRASSGSSPLHPPRRMGMRDRASTTSSFGRDSYDMGTPPPLPGSGRNSTSTAGRPSLGTLLSRLRQGSDPHSPRYNSPGGRSKSNSFATSREALVVPERQEGDTPGKYLERLEAAVSRSMIASILSKSADTFAQNVLRSYTRRFAFFGEPIDMSLRKFLLEADIPKETQQIDRVIQAFADRYHECNPGIFVTTDQAYLIAFSLMMLHTDAFNKNNKRKMQKQDYLKNTSGQDVSDDVLACFYDNICYTPFVHYEEDVDINGQQVLPFKPKKKEKVKAVVAETTKKPSGPVDPYHLLLEQNLDRLRPSIKDTINMDDPYHYKTDSKDLDPNYIQRAFTHTGTLQIISQRSRPTAYEGQLSNAEPPSLLEMQPGIIDIKITKVGTLWRKSAKRKKTRSPWQEWGAVLTGSQLYFFKNAHWAKGLLHQFNSAQEKGRPRTPVTFKPPLQEFKADLLIRTDNAVALVDSTYTRHKHAFTFIGAGGYEEVFLADNDHELNDWLALINYAAAFRSAGVRIRGMAGGAEEDARSREVTRLESTPSARPTQATQTADKELAQKRTFSPQLQRQVMAARRQIMVQKIGEMGQEIADVDKGLDDMLRNARHLLILAPILGRTREDILLAAARVDASLKWTRREIWKLRCYNDILAMDVQQDGVKPAEVDALAQQAQAEAPVEPAKKTWPITLSRLTSRTSAARSPPLSPTTTTSPLFLNRPPTTGSLEAYTNDVFRTPLETTTQQHQEGEWRLPPLQLDVQREQHRASISSALFSTSSQGRNSFSQASTTSSGLPNHRTNSEEPTDGTTPRPRAPSSVIIVDPEVELLARSTMTPDPLKSRNGVPNGEGIPQPQMSTPESTSKNRTSVRRSLQKTLRDTHHHRDSSHKHRRGKESDSTVRSVTGVAINAKDSGKDGKGGTDVDAGESGREEGTPGLQRSKGKFILHGKQASVVHFGPDWPNERMRARRQAWRSGSASTLNTADGHEDGSTPMEKRGEMYGWGVDGRQPSVDSNVDPAMKDDAGVADMLVASPVERKSESSDDAAAGGEEETFFDAETRMGKRGTIIEPRRVDDGVDATTEGNGKRTTVIGPSPPVAHMNGDDAVDDAEEGADDEEYVTPPSSSDVSEDEGAEEDLRPSNGHVQHQAVEVN